MLEKISSYWKLTVNLYFSDSMVEKSKSLIYKLETEAKKITDKVSQIVVEHENTQNKIMN